MPSDLQVSNIKDLTGSNTGISIASDGQVTIAQNNPTVTLGSNATVNTQDYVVATIPSEQTISHFTWTGLNLTSETHDPNNWFDNSTFKFQPNKAGKYFVNMRCSVYSNQGHTYNERVQVVVKKNDTTAGTTGSVLHSVHNARDARGYQFTVTANGIVDLNGSTDYLYNMVRIQLYFGTSDGRVEADKTQFSAYRLGA